MDKKIKTIIFDFNGVFVKSEPLSKRLEEKYGVPASESWPVLKDILKQVRTPGPHSDTVWDPILNLLKTTRNEFFDFWFSGESLNHDLYLYAQELVLSGYKIIILSNNFSERTTYYRQQFPQIFSLVHAAYFSWETGLVKPDPQVFTSLLSSNNLLPGECVYFDDSQENTATAQSLGIHSYIYSDLANTRKIITDLF